MKHKTLKPISIILTLTLLWQNLAWASPDGFRSLRALALHERNGSRGETGSAQGLKSKMKFILLGVTASILAAGLIGHAIISGNQDVLGFLREKWAGYLGLMASVPYFLYFIGCSLVGNVIASFADKDKHWTRFLFVLAISCGYALAVPAYVYIIQGIPDCGVWSHSLRPLADMFIAAHILGVLSFVIMGTRERAVYSYNEKRPLFKNCLERIKDFIKDVFTKGWWQKTWEYNKKKLKLFYGEEGLFMVSLLFWMPIIHFMYYDLDVRTYVGITATIIPFYAVLSAIFVVQRPGKELTERPLLNLILKYSYLAPLIIILDIAVIAFITGYTAIGLNFASSLLTGLVGYGVYKLWNGFLKYLSRGPVPLKGIPVDETNKAVMTAI